MSDTSDKISGKVKATAGKVTGNRKQEIKGQVQYKIADIRQKAKRGMDDMTKNIYLGRQIT